MLKLISQILRHVTSIVLKVLDLKKIYAFKFEILRMLVRFKNIKGYYYRLLSIPIRQIKLNLNIQKTQYKQKAHGTHHSQEQQFFPKYKL